MLIEVRMIVRQLQRSDPDGRGARSKRPKLWVQKIRVHQIENVEP